ncbi:Hsp70 family protein [Dactylosporangium sp. NBC_01737]|uniref:Hsp70 family protein n=1 Tax=Dactylosporangium sp. NBC_01737 TaxID=2975959 RepID=UPI002E0F1EC1|nr:Hsp70 family protein [Dactylosporangium sp. NBC_01737]
MSDFRVAIDYGTSTTVAFLHWPDGKIRPLLFGDSPLLPSAVYVEDDDRPLTGRDAVRSARFDPGRFEANPKRRIDDGEVLLGDRVLPIGDLIAATLRRVWQEATRIAGEVPGQVTLTHPATWGERRRGALLHAADLAGLPAPVLVAEPIAAATYFTVVLGRQVRPGACVVVYDLGAGTFDVSVVRRDAAGFTALGTAGLGDLGGLDLDALVVGLLRDARGPADEAAWEALRAPAGLAGRRAFRELWDAAREAKEALSLRATTPVQVPGVADPQHLTRGEFEAAAVPMLTQTVAVTMEAIRAAGVGPADVAGVFLVGGATRVPLVASLLHRATGMAPTVMEQPELVVAEGALHIGGAAPPRRPHRPHQRRRPARRRSRPP